MEEILGTKINIILIRLQTYLEAVVATVKIRSVNY